MAKLRRIHVPGENRLLAALPRDEYDRLLPHLEKVSLPLKDILYEANGPIPHVFFPLNGVVSLVIIMDGGFSLEVGTIGNEGMVGTPVFLGCREQPDQGDFAGSGRGPADGNQGLSGGDEAGWPAVRPGPAVHPGDD